MALKADRMASNFFAFNPGIMPSKVCSTQTHLTCNSAHRALPRSISKPLSEPSGCFCSKGG
ncbi:hypothetical protein D3C73_1449670 [compost metagenome]